MSKTYHTRESILARLERGPAQFSEWAVSRNANHGSRTQARKLCDELVAEGLIRYLHIGRYPYYILNTPEALNQAVVMQIEEGSRVSECGCIHWTGYVDPHGGGPTVRVAGGNKPESVRRLLWSMNKGPIKTCEVIKVKCEDEACINLDCFYKIQRNSDSKGKKKTLATRVRISETLRKRGKLTMEDARAIRESTEPQTVLAERYGCTKSSIYMIKHNRMLRELESNPFAGLLSANESGRRCA